MPRQKIVARWDKQHNRWRVTIPIELGGGRKFFEKKRDADEFAALKESERREGANRLYGISEKEARYVVDAMDLMKGRESELVDACRLYLAHNTKEQRTLAQAVAEMIGRKRTVGRRAISLGRLENTLNRFAFGRESKPVHEITAAECEAWICAKEAKAESTRRSRQIDLTTFFSFCVKRGWCVKRPTDGLEKYSHGKGSPKILTVQQCETTLKAAVKLHKGKALATVVLQLFCGLRPLESYKVSRAMIKGGQLRLDETIAKTNDIRIVTINPTAKRWLAYAEKIGSPLPLKNWRNKIADIHASAKPWPSDAFRHSFVSYHLEIHGWEKTVEQAGHSLATSFKHYRALTTKADARKFWELKP